MIGRDHNALLTITSTSTLLCLTGEESVLGASVEGLFGGFVGLEGPIWGVCPNFLARSFSFLACACNTVFCFGLFRDKITVIKTLLDSYSPDLQFLFTII